MSDPPRGSAPAAPLLDLLAPAALPAQRVLLQTVAGDAPFFDPGVVF